MSKKILIIGEGSGGKNHFKALRLIEKKIIIKLIPSRKFIKIPKGDPENFMTQDEFIEKFDGLVEPYLNIEKSDELKNFMLKLDNANSIDSLFELSN